MNVLNDRKKRATWFSVLVAAFLMIMPLTMNSCSTDTYDTPLTPQSASPLISPETLKTWVDAGLVNSTGFDRVVILDVTSLATYTAGHIPGAQFVNSNDIYQVRQEGPATDVNMSLDGSHMDALIQKYGIDKNTTIVFTSGGASPSAGSVLTATRTYFTFRYWGFPKEKLKVLDGINFSWKAAYGLVTETPAAPVPSTYSVKNNERLRTDLRASLSDMINVAEGKVTNAVAVDMRSTATTGSYAGIRGSTAGVFPVGTFSPISDYAISDYVVFEGHLKGAQAMLYTNLLESAANNFRFKTPDALAALFNAIGIDGTKYTHVY